MKPGLAALVGLVASAVGCGSLLPKSPKSNFFLLTALEPAPSPPSAPPQAASSSVLLGAVLLPQYLDRRELVTRLDSNQVRVEDLDLWAEPLRESVPRTLQHDLASLLGAGTVQRLPWMGPDPPDAVVSIEIRRFEKTSARTVELEATWMIADGTGSAVHMRKDTRLQLAIGAPSTQAAVGALSDALAALSREIAASLRQVAAR